MTREEAIHIVDVAFGVPKAVRRTGEDRTYHEDEIREAKEMSIAALKAEPCEDAVSRADTLQSFESYCENNCQYSKKQRDVMCGACMMGDAIEIVENLPLVTLKQRWIPVDYDRYPETYPNAFQEVWITDGYGEVYHKAYDGTRSIKAWMPYIKPEPYKEGESE